MSLQIRTTVERAIAAYIQTVSLGGVLLSSFTGTFRGDSANAVPLTFACICGEIAEDGAIPEEWSKLTMPAIVVACPRSERPGCAYDECHVSITAITTPDEVDAPARVQARAGWLAALFHEDNLDLITAALNAPLAGPDLRAVKGIAVIGIMFDGEDHQENGHLVFSSVKLKVSAAGIPDP